jgi:uncharacterized protein (DUF302 family)
MDTTRVAFEARTNLDYESAIERCREELTREGFGVLTEIDVRATLKKKLDADVEPYIILGACHPPSAYKALSAVPEVGVLLPCNVTVSIENGETMVRAMNPGVAMAAVDRPGLEEVALHVGGALQRVIEKVAKS